MEADADDDGGDIIAALLASTGASSKRPRPNSQRCRTCNAPNKWETNPPHKKPKGKGDPSCPFPWKEKPDPALIGKQAALELVRTHTDTHTLYACTHSRCSHLAKLFTAVCAAVLSL